MGFDKRIMEKVITNLTLHEGFSTINTGHPTRNYTGQLMADALGFVYEVSVKCVGRLHNNPEDDSQFNNDRTLKTRE